LLGSKDPAPGEPSRRPRRQSRCHSQGWSSKADFFDAKPITIPFAISVFPDELYQAPRSWTERAYPNNLIHYNRLDRGGHFAAWEQPQLFTEELRVAFGSLR
jgi:pimeloyl-ACP methyl ester carboxylesterase